MPIMQDMMEYLNFNVLTLLYAACSLIALSSSLISLVNNAISLASSFNFLSFKVAVHSGKW